jgi:tetratricopeptide (TPR) repeat protein
MNTRQLSRFLLIGGLTALIGLPVGCAAPRVPPPTSDRPETVERTSQQRVPEIQEAWRAYRQNQFKDVLETLEPLAGSTNQSDVPMLLGLSYYRLDQYRESHEAWQRALERLENVEERSTARSYRDRTRNLKDLDLSVHQYNHFRVLVPPSLSKREANEINHTLSRVYQQIGGNFGYYPDSKLSVILYKPGAYRRAIDAPIWSGGLFDGKMHLKYDTTRRTPVEPRTLYHEYIHAVVYDLARDNVPLWFNEGLATYMAHEWTENEFRYVRLHDQRPRDTIRSLDEINGMFRSEGESSRVRLGYEYSYSLIQFMDQRYGLKTITDILKRTGEESSFETALLDVINTSPDRLQFTWENWVNTQLWTPGR